jgi:Ni,Fe-hydrogenase III large subunit
MVMATLSDIIANASPVAHHRPWSRSAVGPDAWTALGGLLAQGRLALLGLWGDAGFVHMAVLDSVDAGQPAVFSIDCAAGSFPSIGELHPPAIRLERAIRDLFGLQAEALPDSRRWLDHGRWGVRHPMGRPVDTSPTGDPYAFLPATGEGLHQIPVGPVHAGIIEPGHFRFTAGGETVVRLEERLGYVHRGIEGLMAGADLERAARLAERVSGDSTVAYATAYARAVEAALGIDAPPRAHWLRGLMAELERLANHLGDIGAICNDASFALMHAHCGVLRELVLRTMQTCLGHRLMRDCIRPAGIATDLAPGAPSALQALIAELRARFPALVELYDGTTSLQDRTVATGHLTPSLALQYAAGGYVGRASGREFDARRHLAYPPYDSLQFEVPVLETGDVNARVWIRIREVEQSLNLLDQILDRLPDGPVRSDVATVPEAREGMSIVEGFRGDILVWLRIAANGRIERCHLRDPSWFQWPLLEAAIEGNIVADFPLCNKSFNCSYAGHDL